MSPTRGGDRAPGSIEVDQEPSMRGPGTNGRGKLIRIRDDHPELGIHPGDTLWMFRSHVRLMRDLKRHSLAVIVGDLRPGDTVRIIKDDRAILSRPLQRHTLPASTLEGLDHGR